jgi:hypothetical protein
MLRIEQHYRALLVTLKLSTKDIAAVLGGSEHMNLMVRSFAATLGDSHLLVQRNMLELLVQNFRLNAKYDSLLNMRLIFYFGTEWLKYPIFVTIIVEYFRITIEWSS